MDKDNKISSIKKNLKVILIISIILHLFIFFVFMFEYEYHETNEVITNILFSFLYGGLITYSFTSFVYCLISDTYIHRMLVSFLRWVLSIIKQIPKMLFVPDYPGCLTVFIFLFVIMLLIPMFVVGFAVEAFFANIVLSIILSFVSFPFILINHLTILKRDNN